jgi:hypothetical protein
MYKLVLLGVLVSLAGCYTVPSYAYGDLFVTAPYTSDESYSLEVGACQGETLTVRWNVGEGKNPKLIALPAQNVEPPLPSRLEKSGEVQVTFKDSVTISFTIDGGQDFETERQVVAIPEGVCTGFPLELRGNYTGTLEQTTPQSASLPRDLELYWDESLKATLSTQNLIDVRLACQALDFEDELICNYDHGAETLRLEGTVTSAGYVGTYEGATIGQAFKTTVRGTFNFGKVEVEP